MERIARRDAFFGFHTDLHPHLEDTRLGEDTDEAMVERFVRAVRPDYVQHDCKGHYGYAGYHTRVGTPSPGIRKESLRIWREVTARHGVALFVHYSGIWDGVAIEKHPEWAATKADGTREQWATSVFSPYEEELLIPQLKEAADRFELDGAWVDGDCWAVTLDYGEKALEAFREETGITEIPRSKADPHWARFRDFHRERFRRYVTRYVEALHRHRPGFSITSNWMFSSFMPEEVSVPVDFLSGDYSAGDAVNTARLEARYLASTGMPWDLMAWGFNRGEHQRNWTWKPSLQLEQESALSIAQGGGWQVVYQSSRSGYIDDWMIGILAEVGSFLRPRQSLCHKSESVPQVALLYSRASIYDSCEGLFGSDALSRAPIHGPLHALLELHYSVDVMAEHQLAGRLSDYPCIVIPDWHLLPDSFVAEAKDYVFRGGSLLLMGPRAGSHFRDALGVNADGEPLDIDGSYAALEKRTPNAFLAFLHPGFLEANLEADGLLADCGGLIQKVKLTTAEPVHYWYPSKDTRSGRTVASTIARYGKGAIGAFHVPLGESYARSHAPVLRRAVHGMMKRLFPEPLVEVDGPPCVDMVLRRKGNAMLVHLVNLANMQVAPRHAIIDYIPPIAGIGVRVRLPARPKRVEWAYGGRATRVRYEQGVLHVGLDRLEIHDSLVLE